MPSLILFLRIEAEGLASCARAPSAIPAPRQAVVVKKLRRFMIKGPFVVTVQASLLVCVLSSSDGEREQERTAYGNSNYDRVANQPSRSPFAVSCAISGQAMYDLEVTTRLQRVYGKTVALPVETSFKALFRLGPMQYRSFPVRK